MKKFRIALVGCGGMANAWVKYALTREDAEIVALVDIKKENAVKMAGNYKISCPVYEGISQAIKDSGANLVFDVTIPESHKNIVTTSLKLGCNVLGEKPMASSIEDAYVMLEVVKKTGKSYAVMQNRRYDNRIRSLQSIISSGVIGETGFIGADFFLGPHFGGFRDIMDSPLILDMAIHTFDQARFISGADAVSVYCHEFNPPGSWYKGDASAVCIFEMSNGSVFCYRGSWCAEGVSTSWEAEWRITGSKGTAMWDGKVAPYYEAVIPPDKASFSNGCTRVTPDMIWKGKMMHEGCFDEMFLSLNEDRKAETDCFDNIKSMEMVFAAIESSKKGQKVSIKI